MGKNVSASSNALQEEMVLNMKKLIITDEPMIKTSTAKIKRHEEMSKILAEEGAIK